MWVPVRRDRTSKPPLGTPLRSDGHWSVQQNISFYSLNESAGNSIINSNLHPLSVTPQNSPMQTPANFSWAPDGLRRVAGYGNLFTQVSFGGLTPFTAILYIKDCALSGSAKDFWNYSKTTFRLRAGNGSVIIYFNSDVIAINTSYSFIDNKKYFFAVTFDGEIVSLYINGTFVYSSIWDTSLTSTTRLNFTGDGFSNGSVATYIACGWWQKCKTAKQVSSISANPWQVYEPETVWVEVGGSGSETRNLIAAITGQSTTTSIQATALRTLLAAVSGESLTSTIQATIARALLASVAGSSFTPGIEATLSGIISLVASIPAQSLSSTAQATIDRALTAIISGQSGTPSISALVQGIISLVASVSEQSSTPSVAVTTARLLLAAIDGASSTASARATIARGLAAIVSGQSNTPGVAAMLANMVSLAAGISAHSTTPAALATLQRDMMAAIHAATSTGIISASTSRAMSAVIEGQSLTPDNIMATLAGLGLVLDTSIESRTIIRTLQSLTKKYTIHSI